MHLASLVKYRVMNTADKMAKMKTYIESTINFFDEELLRHLWQLFEIKFIDRSGGILLANIRSSVNDATILSLLFGSGGGEGSILFCESNTSQ